MKVERLTIEQLAARLQAVSSRITKIDKYDACIEFKEDPVTPIDIRTITDILSGNAEKIKNPDLAMKLLEFFEKRAQEYEELERRRQSAA